MPVTDYKKWERMVLEEDDDDRPRRPRVTRLNGPSTVTLGAPPPEPPLGTGPVPHTSGRSQPRDALDYSRWDKIDISSDEDEEDDGEEEEERAESEAAACPSPAAGSGPVAVFDADAHDVDALDPEEEAQLRQLMSQPGVAAPPPPQPAKQALPTAEAVLQERTASLSRNGAAREGHLWRQTESEVELALLLPPATRAKDLRPELRPSPEPAAAASVLVHRSGAGAAPLLEVQLAYPVELPDEEDELAWEVTDYEPDSLGGRRALRITLRKRALPGVVVWWTRALATEAEIDPLSIPGRRRAAKAEGMQSVWEQAQAMFKQKVAERAPPAMLDLGEGGEADEGAEERE